jgi:hypothetical protein
MCFYEEKKNKLRIDDAVSIFTSNDGLKEKNHA